MNNQDHDLYRIPPTTGPATRLEKINAHWQVNQRWFVRGLQVCLGVAAVIFVGLVINSGACTPEPQIYTIECPNEESWQVECNHCVGTSHESGRSHAGYYDTETEQYIHITLANTCQIYMQRK